VDYPATLLFSGNQEAEVLIHDICPGGIQVRCDMKTAQMLKTEKGKSAHDFGTIFILSQDGEQIKITVRCRLVYMVKIDEAAFAAGMQFTGMDNANRKILKRFIESSMEPL
jgi:hypothetical protein